MKKVLLLCLGVNASFADNTSLFNQAYQAGQQNKSNLNLNSNSTINSYGQVNKFESTVANNANTGNANSKDMYNNTYGENANPNYLYNEGTKEIAACQSKTDPKCTTLNKYGDKDTQTKLQAYTHGASTRYYLSVKPDPADSSCSKVTRKVPINATSALCVASSHTQSNCNSTIVIGLSYHDCDPTKGECNNYQSNQDCSLTRPYIAPTCLRWRYSYYYGCTANGVLECNTGTEFRTDGWCGSHAEYRTCNGTDYGAGRGGNPTCVQYSDAQLASYTCKVSSYSDGCIGFKK